MLHLDIPGRGICELENLILDANGTIALDGEVDPVAANKIRSLTNILEIYVVTAGTHGKLSQIEDALETKVYKIKPSKEAEQKEEFTEKLGPEKTVSIGNGSNDALMLRKSAIGVTVIGGEGASTEAISSADVVVNNISDALDLLSNPKRLIATLRK